MLVCPRKLCCKNKLSKHTKNSWVVVSLMLQVLIYNPLLVSFGARLHRIIPLVALVPSPSAVTREIKNRKKKETITFLP